ncbi:hypothetical protein BDZ91DRAFT_714527 [Kalaharituber pfeilii]|nr:hypothetical protein BDZ91DRAFT_714527 [Kalaharituber pfeilii]
MQPILHNGHDDDEDIYIAVGLIIALYGLQLQRERRNRFYLTRVCLPLQTSSAWSSLYYSRNVKGFIVLWE